MADISKITLPSGSTYNIKDTVARDAISQLNSFEYTVCATAANTPSGASFVNGDNVTIDGTLAAASTTMYKIYLVPSTNGTKDVYDEYITVKNGNEYVWEMFGNTDVHMSDLGALAKKDTASTLYTPSGTISVPDFTGTEGDVSVSGTPTGDISVGNGDVNYTPSGSLSGGAINVSLTTDKKYIASSASSGGSVSAGTAASCTLPSLGMTVFDETLELTWSAGSFTANVPTEVTMPTFAETTVASGVSKAEISTLPTFVGTGVELKFTGDELTSAGKYTPKGSVSQPTFAGTEATIIVS